MRHDYDVVVAGAGVGGLLIASELSKSCRVLVIDSHSCLNTSKFWVTLKECATVNPHLQNAVDTYFHEMEFADAYRNSYYLKGEYILWDTYQLLSTLSNMIERNGGMLKFSNRFCGYQYIEKGIKTFVNDTEFSSKLLIYCMGYSSPLILAKNSIRIRGYFMLHGAKIKLKSPITPLALSNVMLNNKPKYLEIFPTSTGEAHVVLIYPSKKLESNRVLVEDFNFLINSSIYARHFDLKSSMHPLRGIVPVGDVRLRAMNRLFFFGESAQNNPATTGTCLTRLLFRYKDIARYLAQKIEDDDLGATELSQCPLVLDDFIRKLQLNVFDEVLNSNSDKYAQFIKTIGSLDPELVNKFVFGDLRKSEIANWPNAKQFLNHTNLFLLKPVLKSFI